MREFIRIAFVCLCGFLLVRDGLCLDVDGSAEVGSQEGRSEDPIDPRKDGKASSMPGSARRSVTQTSSNATRDSQLLSLLANRRRQLLSGRLASHINTLATLAHKTHKGNTTFAQLEVRDANSSLVRRITFDNSSNEISPSLKLITTDGSKEIKQDIKPHEIKHLFIPKIYQENRSRAGFINNRKKNVNTVTVPETTTDSIIYVPPEHFEDGVEKAVDLEPDEEFQVDESNHGLYLLNYSDADNITQIPQLVRTTNDVPENTTKLKITTELVKITPETTTSKSIPTEPAKDEKIETNIIANSTFPVNSPTLKLESEKDKTNQTLFMSDEIYNHFRPLESELPVEDMAPFLYFGQKIGGQIIGDNLTNSPSLSASTKSVNFIVAPPDKRRFNSRYSATEKYRNTSLEEEEINEDMDVSVVKNVIEKNKIRNTVKGPAPTRNAGLVNAYRKYSSTTQTTLKPLTFALLNVTEPIVQNVSPDRGKENGQNKNSTNILKDQIMKSNSTQDLTINSTTIVKDNSVKTNVTSAPRNYTRNYLNLRRRPAKLVTDNSVVIPAIILVNATTEKASTVYTAVVTSVSITSSMKGHNKTDGLSKEDNSTLPYVNESKNVTVTLQPALQNDTELTTVRSTSNKPYKHRIRIRTTTTESSLNPVPSSAPLTNETVSRLSQRLANLFRQNNTEEESSVNGSTIRPKNILKRRRPTTTTTTSTTTTTLAPILLTESVTKFSLPIEPYSSLFPTTTPSVETAERTENPIIITSRTSSESISKPIQVLISENNTVLNATNGTQDKEESQNEEVVIEAEKTYTASYVLAGLGLLPVAAVIVFVFKNVLNKKTKEIDTEYEGYFDDGDIKKESPITPVARPPLPTPSKPDQKWEFPRSKLRLQTLLGQGNFGQVWKAEADDLNGHDGLTRLVAVKTIKESATQKEKQELLHEIYIMQKIGTHPNVVTILACCTEQEPYLLIMEYVMCGKMLTYLRERRSRPDRFSGSGTLTSRDLTVFAYCIARGMDYIASKGIVHRDLAARNVLVDHNKLCKIADFGMSRCAGAGARGARGALPVRWMAPEALLYNVYTHHTDVWAFGILLWEIVTLGSTPYAAMSGREVLTAVTEGYRLERPPHCKPQLYRAMHSCWHADPSQRPSFATLKSQLAELLDNEPSEGNYVDLDSFYQESSVYSDPSAIIHDEEGLSAEYDRERRVFRELERTAGPVKFENRVFNFRDEELRNKFGIGTPRMGGFGIRDVPFNDRNFSDGEFNERTFTDNNFTERTFPDKNFNDPNFAERKDGKLSTSSFHRERERENPLVSRNSFNGFPRIATRDNHYQTNNDRNKRVSEFECDI